MGENSNSDHTNLVLTALSPDERQRMLVDWNATTLEFDRDICVHQLFEAQVELNPKRTALVFEDQKLSYAQLNERANQQAHYLCAHGVGPEVLVGLLVERGLGMVIGILGILKAGGAYLPLDPHYPKPRLDFILQDSEVSVVLAQEGLSSLLADYQGKIVNLDTNHSAIVKESLHNPVSAATADSLAYVIYTSGSTGIPKGTLLEHRGLCNISAEQARQFQVDADSRVLQFASPNFDASLFEFTMALTGGGALVLARQEDLLPGLPLIKLLQDKRITILTIPPSSLSLLPPQPLPDLKIINVAGEPCPAELVTRWEPGRHFFNLYGPTECTIWATANQCTIQDRAPHIGRPIANTQIYILDENLIPVPIGNPGELHISGAGLARGYLNQAKLTADKFVANPFSEDPGSRLYKTGDLAKYHPDGNIEYLGRIDHQVKLHGFRVELGEIEAVLEQHSCIENCVVTLREDQPGDKRLIGYVVIRNGQSLATGDIRDYLRDRLPDYMIPEAFVALDTLPLTPNGKLDRNALPMPSTIRPEIKQKYHAPVTKREEQLAAIWGEILRLRRIGRYDNFLDLGGYSLLAGQLLTAVKESTGVAVSLADFYRDPTIKNLSDLIENSSGPELETPPLVSKKREEYLPVTYPQERIIFLNQLQPESLAYNTQIAIHLNGSLDYSVLEATLSEIVRRHEIFRTKFIITDGVPYQHIEPPWQVSLAVVDLQSISGEMRSAEANKLIDLEVRHQFDISRLPLIHWKLFKLANDKHILLQVEHHLVHDGASFANFLSDFKQIYSAYCNGQPTPLDELPVQFADYAVWQRDCLKGSVLDYFLDYWREKLSKPLPILDLPTDRPRPSKQSLKGSEVVINIPADLSNDIRKLSRDCRVTLFATMLTTYFILLHRYTDQVDIIVGSGVANRRVKEAEDLIGMIINTVAMRVNVSGNPTFRELLEQVSSTILEALSYQELPFEKLVKELNPERSLSHNPIFQTMFSFHDSQLPEIKLPKLSGELDYRHNGSSKIDLGIIAIPWSEQTRSSEWEICKQEITMRWEYSEDIFDRGTISRMTEHYIILLKQISLSPSQRVAEIPLLSLTERQKILEQWTSTHTNYPRDKTVVQLFEEQAAATPNAVAVRGEEYSLTYRQLEERANQLAHYLVKCGTEPEQLVGLALERSEKLIIAMLGILKAGGAYLPIDSSYPATRQEFMIKDARIGVLLTETTQRDQLATAGLQIVDLDKDKSTISAHSASPLGLELRSTNLAYVNYTSGSSGTPKGVCIEHHSIVRLLRNTNYIQIDKSDKFAQLSNISFDAATFEIWGALLNGAQLELFSKSTLLSPLKFARHLKSRKITTLFITTALFNQMSKEVPDIFSTLKYVLFGGEAVDIQSVNRIVESGKPEHLLHVYGPTEGTTFSTWHEVTQVTDQDRTIPIGKPLNNTQVYILDDQLCPVPVGISGELYIGGDGLARDYLYRPELTAEKFIQNPFVDDPTARLYKSGDQVRWLENGTIEFLGRRDQQVKLRGFRIELGEIETTLNEHPEVSESVAIVREDDPGERRLVAYLVKLRDTLDEFQIRKYLEERLPSYMLPGFFVFLNELPLSPNGKVYRNALPLPMLQRDIRPSTEPRTATEAALTRIWCEILRLDTLSVHDNFFEIGGHSLIATRIVSRIREEFNIEMPIARIFECPNVAELAMDLDATVYALKGHEQITVDEIKDRERGEI